MVLLHVNGDAFTNYVMSTYHDGIFRLKLWSFNLIRIYLFGLFPFRPTGDVSLCPSFCFLISLTFNESCRDGFVELNFISIHYHLKGMAP